MKNTNLGPLQFYYRNTKMPNYPKNVVLDFVSFEYDIIEGTQLIIQKRNKETLGFLDVIYQENYNVGYLQEGHDLASKYGNDFIDYVVASIKKYNTNARRISEIGAGGCSILYELKKLGFEVAAIDPSPIAHKKGKEFGIEVVAEFYPSINFIPKSDVIIHYDVLEHIDNTSDFLRSNLRELKENGIVVFAVPDCTDNIKTGDISMFIHQHLNYFDQDSLSNLLKSEGFEIIDIEKSKYGNVLYCCVKKGTINEYVERTGNDKLKNFQNLANENIKEISNFVSEGLLMENSLGFYIPLRALSYLSCIGVTQGFRFFDDDRGIHKQYFDGFPIPVENRQDLIAKPVTHLLIMSHAFGEKISKEIHAILPNIKILTYSEVTKHIHK
jgi:2-polyprenyl-3-methyl-5-hydroxy-6-metoxy-1,4-benzoquinol methylase